MNKLVSFYHSKAAQNIVFLVSILSLFGVYPEAMLSQDRAPSSAESDTSVTLTDLRTLYCESNLLHTVNMVGLFENSKDFVDMPLREGFKPKMVLEEFNKVLEKQDKATLKNDVKEFVEKHFDTIASSQIKVSLPDYIDPKEKIPPLIEKISNQEYKTWAIEIVKLWPSLSRIVDTRKISSYILPPPIKEAEHSKLFRRNMPNKNQNVLVFAGDHFREPYYWDSHWTMRGLLISDMPTTARGMMNTLLEFANYFGFVPNGARVYYTNRSQPPFLFEMVRQFAKKANCENDEWDIEFLKIAVPLLAKEHSFWMQKTEHYNPVTRLTYRPHAVEIVKDSKTHILNRYAVKYGRPRPESYREDYQLANKLYGTPEAGKSDHNAEKRATLYDNIASSAESGWDHNSRYDRISGKLETTYTMSIVPVDLNAILYRKEKTLSEFYSVLGDEENAKLYATYAAQRLEAITAVFWNETLNCWRDFNLETQSHIHWEGRAASDYFPLWAGAYDSNDENLKKRVLHSFETSGLIQVTGVISTTIVSKHQWDNKAWPHINDIIVEGLLNMKMKESTDLAQVLIKRWILNCYTGWKKDKKMYEKYDAKKLGAPGDGEYEAQVGFGWTNGVILRFLTEYENLYQ